MLYCLYHKHIVSEDGFPDSEDVKIIGHYASLDRTLETMNRYKTILGFTDFPYGFGIEVVLQKDFGDIPADKRVYRNGYTDFSAIDGIDTFFEGYYISKDRAGEDLQRIQSLPCFAKVTEDLETYEVIVDMDQWPEGFVSE